MKLPVSLPFGKKEESHYFLSLVLAENKVHATIFEEVAGKIHIVGQHEHHLINSIDNENFEDLLTALDKAISTAESTLPEGYETRKTIFGVKETWIEDTKIKKEYLSKLKKICDTLGLSAIGFLVIHEAIAHLLEKEEGAPPSGILVEDDTKEIAVSVLKAGRVLETQRLPKGESLAKTIDKALHYFKSFEILPSRIILFNAKNHEEVSQELISHQWSKTLPFLHVPQITVLPKGFDIKSILAGAATQMGFELPDIPLNSSGEKFESSALPSFEKEKAEVSELKHDITNLEKELEEKDITTDNFGFLEDADIANEQGEPKKAISDDVLPKKSTEEKEIQNYNEQFFSSEHESIPSKHTNNTRSQKLSEVTQQIKGYIRTLFSSLPLKQLPVITLPKKKGIIFIPPAIIAVLLLLLLVYIFSLKATIILTIAPKTAQESKDIIFSPKDSTDNDKDTIHAEQISVEEQGNSSTPTTGKKQIGDKAKGTVTILSSASQTQNIPSGTALTSSNGLTFTTDSAIPIASSSGVSDIKSTQVNVTAKDIGKEYNLPSGTKFSVGSLDRSSVEGKNDNAFAGGSKKDVTVVTTTDVNKLLNDLPKNLEEKAKSDLLAKIPSGDTILPTNFQANITKKSFNKNVGDEASTVTLTATVTFTTIAYKTSDIQSYALHVLSANNSTLIPSKDHLSFTIDTINLQKNGTTIGSLHAKTFLLPTVDIEKLKKDIAGKSFSDARTTLMATPQANNVEITLHPNLGFLPALLPRMDKNITLQVKSQ